MPAPAVELNGGLWVAKCPEVGRYEYFDARPQVRVTLQLKWVANAGYVGDLVAARFGRQWAGVDLAIRPAPQMDSFLEVLSGDADFGVTTGDRFLEAAAQELPVVAIALAYQDNPLEWVVRDITSVEQLAGKRVGLTGIDDRKVLQMWLRSAGMTMDDVQSVTVQGNDTERFIRGDIDAYPVFRNTQGVALDAALGSRDEYGRLTPSSAQINPYSNLYFTTRSLLDEHPTIVRRFLQAVMLGWSSASTDVDGAVQVVGAYDGSTSTDVSRRAVVESTAITHIARPRAFGLMTEAGWRHTATVVDVSDTTPFVPPGCYTNDFVHLSHEALAAA